FGYLAKDANVAIVLPQNWLFLRSYLKLRRELLTLRSWHVLTWLGQRAFRTPLDVRPVLVVLGSEQTAGSSDFSALDVSDHIQPEQKAGALIRARVEMLCQTEQLKNPDCRIVLHNLSREAPLGGFAECYQGILTGDKD